MDLIKWSISLMVSEELVSNIKGKKEWMRDFIDPIKKLIEMERDTYKCWKYDKPTSLGCLVNKLKI